MSHFALSLADRGDGIYDLHLEDTGDLATVIDSEAVGQHARQKLMTYYREWFLNTEVGVRWLQDIMGKDFDPGLSEAMVKAEILDTDGVVSIEGFSVSFARIRRELVINEITVLTTYDEVTSL